MPLCGFPLSSVAGKLNNVQIEIDNESLEMINLFIYDIPKKNRFTYFSSTISPFPFFFFHLLNSPPLFILFIYIYNTFLIKKMRGEFKV